MIACKFQMDASGMKILIYSEDMKTVFTECSNPMHVAVIASHLKLTAMTKAYATAEIGEDGFIQVGRKIKADF